MSIVEQSSVRLSIVEQLTIAAEAADRPNRKHSSLFTHEQQHQQLQPPTGTNNSTNRHQQAPTTPPTACNSA
jgi:hypothetical protein